MGTFEAEIAIRRVFRHAEVKAGSYLTPEGWEKERREVQKDIQKGYDAFRALLKMASRKEKEC